MSSAAQAPVDVKALAGETQLTDHEAYAQSKLAMIAWSRHLAQSLNGNGPAIVSINPGSMLASTDGERGLRGAWRDIQIGAKILVRAALSDEFEATSGDYFDNDSVRFGSPHPDALDARRAAAVVKGIEGILARTAR